MSKRGRRNHYHTQAKEQCRMNTSATVPSTTTITVGNIVEHFLKKDIKLYSRALPRLEAAISSLTTNFLIFAEASAEQIEEELNLFKSYHTELEDTLVGYHMTDLSVIIFLTTHGLNKLVFSHTSIAEVPDGMSSSGIALPAATESPYCSIRICPNEEFFKNLFDEKYPAKANYYDIGEKTWKNPYGKPVFEEAVRKISESAVQKYFDEILYSARNSTAYRLRIPEIASPSLVGPKLGSLIADSIKYNCYNAVIRRLHISHFFEWLLEDNPIDEYKDDPSPFSAYSMFMECLLNIEVYAQTAFWTILLTPFRLVPAASSYMRQQKIEPWLSRLGLVKSSLISSIDGIGADSGTYYDRRRSPYYASIITIERSLSDFVLTSLFNTPIDKAVPQIRKFVPKRQSFTKPISYPVY
jgi:hypothetical protein